ncbi:GntR family transcriptional regulator [Mycobacterium cookii]|uniref:GntR family transcriptional regulator n=1 Tax=Nocardioides furvisabuli TaxID=375542 RepID=A0ABN2XIG4_9ACTN|nr:FCD domain-containing protein [Nocardioides furvisabuli]
MSDAGPGASPRSPADEAVFRPVRAGNAFEETVERLLQAIKLGVVPPGGRLPAERDLSARLNVSRATLREAIRELARAGFVESRRGRHGGTFVRAQQTTEPLRPLGLQAVSAQEVEDVLTMRHVLEVGAAEAAAGAALRQQDRSHLRACLDECSAATLTDYRRMDSRLHLAIAEMTGSASLTAAVADARSRLNVLLGAIPLLERNIAHSNEQHTRVVAAIHDGDPARARSAMAEHLAGTSALLHGFLT